MSFVTPLRASALLIALASAAHADFQISGVFQYAKTPINYSGAAYTRCFQLPVNRPIPYALVRVIDASTNSILLEGSTDANGAFSGLVPTNGQSTVNLFARCYAHVGGDHFGAQVFHVIDPSGAEYSVKSSVYRNWPAQQALNFGTVTAQDVVVHTYYTDSPFNNYNNIVSTLTYFESVSGYQPTAPLALMWPVDGSNDSYGGGTVNLTWLKGGNNDSLQLHEMGHYLVLSYSSNWATDGGGGVHTLDNGNEPPGLALSEGLATALGSMIRRFRGDADPEYYTQCNTDTRSPGFVGSANLESAGGGGGPGSELAIAEAIWDCGDTTQTSDGDNVDDDPIDGSFRFQGLLTGERLIWDALLNVLPTFPNTQVRTMDLLVRCFFSPIDWGHDRQILSTLNAHDMFYSNDQWEPDNTIATATPLAAGSWSPVHTLFYAPPGTCYPGSGDSDYFSFTPTPNLRVFVQTRYGEGTCSLPFTEVDPAVTIWDPNGQRVTSSDGGGQCGPDVYGQFDRNVGSLFIPIVQGAYIIQVSSGSSVRETGVYQVMWQ